MRFPVRIPSRLRLVLALPLLLVAALPAIPSEPVVAQETFVIPRDEGYGVAECLKTGSACAATIADAWCAAMGRGRSISFGAPAVVERASAREDFTVTCGG